MKKIFLLALIALLFSACEYKFTEPETGTPVDPNDTISFQTQIIPIFETGNGDCISCHKPGGTSPDLTAANAYNEIVSKGLVNSSDVKASKIYVPSPTTSDHDWNMYSTSEDEIVLLWLTQGAQNN